MPNPPLRTFQFPQTHSEKKDIANLYTALKKLGLDVFPEEVDAAVLVDSIEAAAQT